MPADLPTDPEQWRRDLQRSINSILALFGATVVFAWVIVGIRGLSFLFTAIWLTTWYGYASFWWWASRTGRLRRRFGTRDEAAP